MGMRNMKKFVGIVILSLVFASMLFGIVAASESVGPAPNSGDGDPDGSGLEEPYWQNEDRPGMGPAPSSGDGDPDGSGF
jgi:hypothetical protein